ncbi:MAG TPA: acyltransferase [Bacteroidales bacterium]|nr:acyltransferase [Bacteroidales bacterium]HXK80527.1 acyltransferase [Bacteroidales bacterium]
MDISRYIKNIFEIKSENDFNHLLLQAINYQLKNNSVYKEYYKTVNHTQFIYQNNKLPLFLPIRFFKSKKVITGTGKIEKTFESSGTTNTIKSKHFVSNLSTYNLSLKNSFELFFGKPSEYTYLALLPGYIERDNASLIYMLKTLMNCSNSQHNGFYNNDFELLKNRILELENSVEKYMIWGVSHALIKFSETYKLNINKGIIVETGGMKGIGKELIRESLHEKIKHAFGVCNVYSEYGMTELLSQAYSKGNGLYKCPPWMKVFVREPNDPFSISSTGSGALNIIDLANINSCCFIETEDLATIHPDGSFEIKGRFDYSELRGCNMMIE